MKFTQPIPNAIFRLMREASEYMNTNVGDSTSSGIPGEVLVRTGRTNLLDAMQGLVPGLTVSNGRAVIRDGDTINGSTDPLFILDGVEVASLAFVSVSDVESVEVQKDGSMYGSKGANGVIRVTTKHGKKKR